MTGHKLQFLNRNNTILFENLYSPTKIINTEKALAHKKTILAFISAETLSAFYYFKKKAFCIVLQIISLFNAIDEKLKKTFKINNLFQR